ncbi:MAG: hypothetical protein KUG81_09605 [Gammaproteobacteria bacterium]|nr:hypothetical protein [Gammaproteobacteria bacterium]
MSKNLSPARLNMTDLPRDPQRCLGPLRQALIASTNYCKRYPKKLDVLMSVLKYVYAYCMEIKKAEAIKAQAAKEAADKAKIEAEALALEEAKKLTALKSDASE